MGKTIKDWLSEMEEPNRSKALKNRKAELIKDNTTEEETLKNFGEARNLTHAIMSGFTWEDTPEGHDYWDSIYDSL